jgi:short-subunit dehydrogenase
MAWTRALVTGASSGIGEALARQAAASGADLVVVARRETRLEHLKTVLEGRSDVQVEVLVADLTDPEGLAAVEERLGKGDVDLLVNNAGFGTTGQLAELDVDRMSQEIALDVTALARLTRAALPSMLERRHGGILNVSSIVSFFPTPRMAIYAGSKAFVTSFTQSVAEEVRDRGVKVSALCPGLTRTEFQEVAHEEQPRNMPGFAWQSPEQVARAGLKGLEGGKVMIVPGLHNQALRTAVRLTPRGVLRRAAGYAQGARGA